MASAARNGGEVLTVRRYAVRLSPVSLQLFTAHLSRAARSTLYFLLSRNAHEYHMQKNVAMPEGNVAHYAAVKPTTSVHLIDRM